MRSRHADLFNHDEDAPGYDEGVADESNPVRTGYRATLRWVAEAARIDSDNRVLELGSGSGNLTRLLPPCRSLLCVDVSQRMEDLAAAKLSAVANRTFMKEDILQIFDRAIGPFDVILSTYTAHHLTDQEKVLLFRAVFECLSPGGRAVFGDLMLESRAVKETKLSEYRLKGYGDVVESLEEEFFWFVDEAKAELEEVGFRVDVKRFSDLSFGFLCER